MSLGNSSIHQIGEIPEITKLFNGRIRVVRRFAKFTREDVDNVSLGSLLGSFGDLDTTDQQVANQGYTDCSLIQVEVDTRVNATSNTENPMLVQTYETLTDAFVQETADQVDYEMNNLRRVQRSVIAKDGTAYTKEVGTSKLIHNEHGQAEKTLYLAQVDEYQKESSEGGFVRFIETWLEAGTLSETFDQVGSQQSKVIETIGGDPTTPAGYSLASKQESNLEGFQTSRFTFLKPSILSVQQDFNNGLKIVSVQAFDMSSSEVSSDLTEIHRRHMLISQNESDYDGIKTTTFQYQISESFIEVYDVNGFKQITINEISSSTITADSIGSAAPTGSPAEGLFLSTQKIDNGGSIKASESTYVEAGVVSRSEVQGPDGLPDTKTVTYVSQITEPTSSGVLLSKSIDNTEGYKIYTYRYLEGRDAGSTPIGVLQSYEQIIEVRTAGSVTATGGGVGSLPYITSIPPRIGKVKATVSISLTLDNTVSVPVAYNLSETSCSATTVNTKETPIGVEQGGSLSIAVYNTRQTTSHQPFSNYYATNSGDTGSITTAASIVRDNDSIIGETLNETSSSSIVLTGSTTAPVTTGIYDQILDPVFIDAAGVQYYRKTTYTV